LGRGVRVEPTSLGDVHEFLVELFGGWRVDLIFEAVRPAHRLPERLRRERLFGQAADDLVDASHRSWLDRPLGEELRAIRFLGLPEIVFDLVARVVERRDVDGEVVVTNARRGAIRLWEIERERDAPMAEKREVLRRRFFGIEIERLVLGA